jgi:glucose-6-phosphate 1-dehydrogenase
MLTTHLLHVLSFAAMDPPPNLSASAITTEIEKVFASITPLEPECVVRGQYVGYLETPGVAPDSQVETFVAARIEIHNHRWHGVPFILRTGKALATKQSAVTVVFKAPPRAMFPGGVAHGGLEPNHLRLDLDRPGCLKLGLMTKEAGWDMNLHASTLGIDGAASSGEVGAYERLLQDALLGDRTLFTSIDAVDRAWEIVGPVLSHPPPLHRYTKNGWGPAAADRLIAPHPWALSQDETSK